MDNTIKLIENGGIVPSPYERMILESNALDEDWAGRNYETWKKDGGMAETINDLIFKLISKFGAGSDYYGTTEITLNHPVDDVLVLDDNRGAIYKYPETKEFFEGEAFNKNEYHGEFTMIVKSIWRSGREVAVRGSINEINPDQTSPSDLRIPIELIDTDCFPYIYNALKDTLENQ